MTRIAHTVLTALPPPPRDMSLSALVRATGFTRDQVKAAIDRLSRRGLALHVDLASYRRSEAGDAFLDAGRKVKPGKPKGAAHDVASREPLDTLRDRAWRALRQIKKGTLPEILDLAATGDEREGVDNLRQYLRQLVDRGIVARLQRRVPGLAPTSNGHHQFLLLRDLGPVSPLWLKHKRKLIDRNTGKEVIHE